MSAKQNQNTESFAPKVLVAIGYSDVYKDEEAELSVADHLKGIPSMDVIRYVLSKHWPLHYVMNAPEPHQEVIAELDSTLTGEAKTNLSKLQENNDCILITPLSTLHIVYEALRNFVPTIPSGNNSSQITIVGLQNIYKAYLKANSYWTSKQKVYEDAIDMMLSIDVPFAEFRHPKPLISSVYKALRFFEFCESHRPFDDYLKQMLADQGVCGWHQYVDQILDLFPNILESPLIKFDKDNKWVYDFFCQFAVDVDDIARQKEWDGNESIRYLRDHFVVKVSDSELLFLSPDLIVDKLYQALKFKMWESVDRHKLLTPKGREFNNLPEFFGLLGDDFSEKYLANGILTKIFGGRVDAIYTDEDVKAKGITGPSDFYILSGDNLAVIEYKDLTIPDSAKHSGDIEEIKKTILNRICLDTIKTDSKGREKRTQKGFGQILDSVSRILRHEYDGLDSRLDKVKNIYPIVVTTDITVSALGVNLLVIKETAELMKKHAESHKDKFVFLAAPVIIDLNTLIDCAYMFHKGTPDFFTAVFHYLMYNVGNQQSFDVFAKEILLRDRSLESDIAFLFA